MSAVAGRILGVNPPLAPVAAAPAGRPLWVQVEAGLHVANTGSGFVGTVTATPYGYEAMDGVGARRGTFVSLTEAKTALEEVAGGVAVPTASAAAPAL